MMHLIKNPFFADLELSEKEKQIRKRSAAYTAGVFALLLLIFLLAGLSVPKEDKQRGGIEVVVGDYDEGFRDWDDGGDEVDEPIEETTEPDQEEAEPEETADSPDDDAESPADDDAYAHDHPDADPLETEETQSEEAAEEDITEEETEPEQEVDDRAMFPGRDGQPRGEDEEPETAGQEEGDEDTESFADRGEMEEEMDEGLAYDLGGRRMVKAPDIEDETQKQGKVVVRIVVDQEGRVTHVQAPVRGTTTSDAALIRIARDAAYDTEFEADPDAPSEQTGTMEFIFRLE